VTESLIAPLDGGVNFTLSRLNMYDSGKGEKTLPVSSIRACEFFATPRKPDGPEEETQHVRVAAGRRAARPRGRE
jgi:hypothetical protein